MKFPTIDDGIGIGRNSHMHGMKHGGGMRSYKLEILEPPDERLKHRREFQAPDDKDAIKRADKFYDQIAADPNTTLDRYVLYEGDRVVHERIGSKR